MKRFAVLLFILQSFFAFSQELGIIKNGEHSLKFHKNQNQYSISFSTLKSNNISLESEFSFYDKEAIFNIIKDGFNKERNHQLIVQTNNDTIVKFEFRKLKGNWFLKIKHNNLISNKIHSSSFFEKEKILKLFQNTINS